MCTFNFWNEMKNLRSQEWEIAMQLFLLYLSDDIEVQWSNDGILIYESQKLNRNRHKQHAQRMIASFRKVFGNEFQIKAGRSRDQRTVHYYKKNL